MIIEAVILLSAEPRLTAERRSALPPRSRVDTDAVALKVRHEFAAKDKAKVAKKAEQKPPAKQKAKQRKSRWHPNIQFVRNT